MNDAFGKEAINSYIKLRNSEIKEFNKKESFDKTKSITKWEKNNKTELASLVGKSLSERAKAKKVKQVHFDRNGFKYHGRIKSFAEASRKGGLKF